MRLRQCLCRLMNLQRLLCKFGGNSPDASEQYGIATGWRAPYLRHSDLTPVPSGPFVRHNGSDTSASQQLWNTVYSKRKLVGGRPNVFVSIFTPHQRESAATAMAAASTINISTSHNHYNVSISVALEDGNALHVTMDSHDVWTMK